MNPFNISNIFSSLGDSIKGVVGAFKANPEKVLEYEIALKKIVAEHELEMQKMAQSENEAVNKDKENARNREIELAKAGSKWGIITMNIAAALIIAAFFATNILPFFMQIPTENKSSLELINARLGDATLLILGYWFGSSRGSQEKQNQIDKFLSK